MSYLRTLLSKLAEIKPNYPKYYCFITELPFHAYLRAFCNASCIEEVITLRPLGKSRFFDAARPVQGLVMKFEP